MLGTGVSGLREGKEEGGEGSPEARLQDCSGTGTPEKKERARGGEKGGSFLT